MIKIKCDKCDGTGHITTIFDTQIQLGSEIKTLSSKRGPKEKCDKCDGTGFLRSNSGKK
jgi:hypothetical protein